MYTFAQLCMIYRHTIQVKRPIFLLYVQTVYLDKVGRRMILWVTKAVFLYGC